MKRVLICIAFILFLFLYSYATAQDRVKAPAFQISSRAFENGGKIPKTYTCDGANMSPPLHIENIPLNTKSLVLILDDIDAPRGTYIHWILWNMDPNRKEIKEHSVPEGAVQGMNDFKTRMYGGPCPPRRAHRYVFKVYALDTLLDLSPHSTKRDLEKAMQGRILSRTQLTGVYERDQR